MNESEIRVAVTVDGRTVEWVNGQFTGDADLVRTARIIANSGWPTRLVNGGDWVTAGNGNALAATAAMIAVDVAGRAVVVEAPPSVWAHLQR